MENVFSISFRKIQQPKQRKLLISFDHQNVNSLALHHRYNVHQQLVLVLLRLGINLLAFYHEYHSLIGYATIYYVIDSEQRSSVHFLIQ